MAITSNRKNGLLATLTKFAWVPLPVFIVAIIAFRLKGFTTPFVSVQLQLFFNFVFTTLTSVIILVLLGRSFINRGSPGLLMIGCGALVWGAIGITGFFTSDNDADIIIIIYNSCIWLSALFHLCGALLTLSKSRLIRDTGKWLAAAYLFSAGAVALITYLLLHGQIPLFYIQGQGGMFIRNMILVSSILLFVLTLLLLSIYNRKPLSPFMKWYTLAIALFAIGLLGFLAEKVHADPISWVARTSQYLSGIYMLMAAILSTRDIRLWSISLKAALRESEARYRNTLDNMMEGCAILNFDWTYLYVNKVNARQVHLTQDEMIGHNMLKIQPWIVETPFFANYKKCMLSKAPLKFEDRYNFPDGSAAWYETSVSPVPEGIFILSIDTTERKFAEEALNESEEKYKELVENANSIIIKMDREGRITFFNEFAQKFFGYSEAEIIGKTAIDSIVPRVESTGRDMVEMLANIYEDPDMYSININENIKRNGERVWVEWYNRTLLDKQGNKSGHIAIGTDITERKLASEVLKNYEIFLEDTVKKRTAELEAAKIRAESADKLKSAFLANLSHELRTPLNSIIGFSGILLQEKSGALNEEQKKQLGMVQTSGRHLLSLINDILDLSKIDAGQFTVNYESFNIHEVIEEVMGIQRLYANQKGLSLTFVKSSDHGDIISDRQRIQQVLLNLLNNAIKFTDKGYVTIRCSKEKDFVRVEVSDTGIGIDEANQVKLFSPFIQIENDLTRRYEGSGLGLSICKKLIELLNGTINVKSEYGVGSTFSIALPLAKETEIDYSN